jgi:hypothetical protein
MLTSLESSPVSSQVVKEWEGGQTLLYLRAGVFVQGLSSHLAEAEQPWTCQVPVGPTPSPKFKVQIIIMFIIYCVRQCG